MAVDFWTNMPCGPLRPVRHWSRRHQLNGASVAHGVGSRSVSSGARARTSTTSKILVSNPH
eukprot:11637310-Alexandrium_andersonii.AAC.1